MSRVAIDANLMLLLVVGEANRRWIARQKGLRVYDDEAFDLLIEGIGDVSRIVVTPNVPTRGRSGSIARRGLSSKAFGARRC